MTDEHKTQNEENIISLIENLKKGLIGLKKIVDERKYVTKSTVRIYNAATNVVIELLQNEIDYFLELQFCQRIMMEDNLSYVASLEQKIKELSEKNQV
jgi:hypothetical protein